MRFAITDSTGLAAVATHLIAEGHDPNTLAEWHRNGTTLFTTHQTLQWWADRYIAGKFKTSRARRATATCA